MKKLLIIILCLVPSVCFGAIAATTIWEVQTGGAQTGGAGFNPGNANMLADLTCTDCNTNAAALTSAGYTFLAGDVGHWVYIKSGTGWTSGWYKIASVATGVATVISTIGTAIQGTAPRLIANTVAGVSTSATRADPNFGTWTMDYSQGVASIFDHTDLVIGTTGSETNVTSAAHPFTTQEVGNHVRITAGTGFTVGWYEIVSISGVTAILDRAVGTADSTGGTYYLGGAFLIGGTLDDDFFEAQSATGGNTTYIKLGTGTYTLGESISISTVDGTQVLPVYITAYNLMRGDSPTGANRPTLATGASYTLTFGDYYIVRNVIFTKPSGNASMVNSASGDMFINCKFSHAVASASYSAISVGTGPTSLIGSEVVCTGCNAISSGINQVQVIGSYIHDSLTGINGTTGSILAINNIFDTLSTASIVTTTNTSTIGVIYGNTFYNGSSPAAIAMDSTSYGRMIAMNNIFSGFLTPNVWDTWQGSNWFNYNAYYNEGSDQNTNVLMGTNSITDLDPGFADAPNADFRLTGNTNMKGVGFPGAWVPMGAGASLVGYPDLGAVQRVEPSASGGGAWPY